MRARLYMIYSHRRACKRPCSLHYMHGRTRLCCYYFFSIKKIVSGKGTIAGRAGGIKKGGYYEDP